VPISKEIHLLRLFEAGHPKSRIGEAFHRDRADSSRASIERAAVR
jgi:hypothetical protein